MERDADGFLLNNISLIISDVAILSNCGLLVIFFSTNSIKEIFYVNGLLKS